MSKYNNATSKGSFSSNESTLDKHKNLIVGVAMLLLVALLGGGMWWLFNFERKGFSPTTHKFEYRRAHHSAGVADTANDKNPKPDHIFSATMVEKYELGQGVEIPFVVETPTGDQTVKTFNLKTYKEFEEEDNPTRRNEIRKAQAELEKLVADWTTYKPVTWNVEIYVDVTSGWDAQLVDQVETTLAKKGLEAFGNKSLKERIDEGDTVNLFVYKITNTDYVDGQSDEVSGAGSFAKVNSTLQWVWKTSSKSGTGASSVATTLLNDLDENAGKPNRVILVFSDFVENFGSTALMYGADSKLLDQAHWSELEEKLLSQRKLQGKKWANLTGASVYGFAPKTGANAELIRKVLLFYEKTVFAKSKAAKIRLSY